MQSSRTSLQAPTLITGATGLLGDMLVCKARELGHGVIALAHSREGGQTGVKNVKIDLTQSNAVLALLDRVKPRLIIHSAAATDVDRCEREPEWARQLNVEATQTLVDWAQRNGSYFVYVSTDSVFDGSRGDYRESDDPHPLNVYAKTKRQGEEVVQAKIPAHLILRTNFFGWSSGGKESLGEWVLRGLASQTPLKTFTDVRFSPLFTQDLAQLLFDLVEQDARGIYHVAAKDAVSKHEFAVLLSQAFDLAGTFVPVSIDTFTFRARRGKDTSLNSEKISRFLNRDMPTVNDEIHSFKTYLAGGQVRTEQKAWIPVEWLHKTR